MPCYFNIYDKLLQIQFQEENIKDTRKTFMIDFELWCTSSIRMTLKNGFKYFLVWKNFPEHFYVCELKRINKKSWLRKTSLFSV